MREERFFQLLEFVMRSNRLHENPEHERAERLRQWGRFQRGEEFDWDLSYELPQRRRLERCLADLDVSDEDRAQALEFFDKRPERPRAPD
jgi:hypothetical protein